MFVIVKKVVRPRVGALVYTATGRLGVVDRVLDKGRLDCRRIDDGGHLVECRHPACLGQSVTCPICRFWATDSDVARPADLEGLVSRTLLEAAVKASPKQGNP